MNAYLLALVVLTCPELALAAASGKTITHEELWLMPRVGPKGLEFARARTEMKAIETILHLRRERPALVFSFDPRHGSSCHSGHRATAELLVEAALRLAPEERPQLWLEQTDDIDDRPGIAADRRAIITATGFAAWPDTAAVVARFFRRT